MARYIQDGQSIDHTPGSAVSAGDVVVVGSIVGIALSDIAANALGAIQIAGVAEFPKTAGSSEAIAVGTVVYWDSSAGAVDTITDTGANELIGTTVEATVDADTVVNVLMHR